ncbi:MAG: translocation/assembly module TamB domain-containing protein, partial [Bacteroidales bacterium]|nr:translocation/assembly module TamB domain-containing protein [Bacteroidales bacterium]
SRYPISGIAELAPGHILTFKGSLNGLLDDYVAYGVIDSPGLGSLNIDAICRNERNLGLEVLGMMNTNGLNVGEIIQAKNIGMLAFDATATIFAAINPDQSYVSLDNLYISRLDFNDYSYSGITAAGNLEPTGFVGQVQSTDPNFKFDFDGVVSFPSHEEENTYNFTLDVDNINLVALNFDKERNGNINLSANANFVLSKDKELNGKFVIDSIHYTVGDVPYSLDKIEILSQRSSDNVTTASLMSSFLKGTVKTNASAIDDILTDLRRQILLQHLSHLTDEESRNSIGSYASGNWYDIKFATGDLRPIFAFLKPDLHVDKGTSLDIHVDEYGNMNGKILSELIALGNIFIKGLDVSLTNDMNDLKSTVYSEIIQYGNIKTYSDTIHLNLRENVADVTLSYNNHDSLANKGLFNTAIALYDKQNGKNPIGVTLYDSFIKFYENTWLLDKASVNYSENHVAVDNFNLHNGNQSLTIDGMMTESIGDTCKVLLNNFDVGILNSFLGLDFLSHGNATGYVSIVAPFSMFDLDGDIDIDSLSLAGCYMGDFCIKSDWVEENKLVNFSVISDIDDLNPLNVAGSFSPEKKEVDAKVSLENLNIGFIEPILTGLMENISGSISGDIEISGPLNNLSVKSSDCHIDDMHTTLSFTKVPYTVNGVFNLDEKGVNVKNIDIRDQFSGYGTMTGKVTYDHFKDIALDLNMRLNNLHGVNTTILDSPMFYGQAFASGNIHIGGLINAIELALRLTTEPNTSIHIPLSSNGKEQASVITFVSDTKPVYNSYDSLINLRRTIAEEAVSKSGMKVNLQMDITQDADVMIEINRTTGDIIRSKGVGYVDINLENENLDIKGDYSINEGNYRFGMLSIVTRDFTITPGSKINFVGDVMDSEFDVEAIYRTKASIAALVSDSTSVTSRRPVNCAIDLTGKLSDLNIDFNIDLPDIDPIYEDVIMGALNTEEKRLKQFMALLVSNSFLPDEQSGINERANVSFLNASEILSNQLSTILNELDIPVDLGFNYQTGITGTNLFDVAISTQLFNNRVSINGNFGNREQLSSSSQHSDLVGDIDVEIKVDKNGKVRVTLFSHSGDILSSYLDNSQRNGVGIALQEDFNTFRELLRNIFWSKKRRAEYDRQVREGQMEEAARTTSPPIILKSSKK